MTRFYIVHMDRRHVPAVAGPFLTEDAAREYLSAEVIGPGMILRRDVDDLLPVVTIRSDGTEIRHQHGK